MNFSTYGPMMIALVSAVLCSCGSGAGCGRRAPTDAERAILRQMEAVAANEHDVAERLHEIRELARRLVDSGYYVEIELTAIPVPKVQLESQASMSSLLKGIAEGGLANNVTWTFVPATSAAFRRIESEMEDHRAYQLHGLFSRSEIQRVCEYLRSEYPAWRGMVWVNEAVLRERRQRTVNEMR